MLTISVLAAALVIANTILYLMDDARRRRTRVDITSFAYATHFTIYWRDGGQTTVRMSHEISRDPVKIFDTFYDAINPLPTVTQDRWQEFLSSGWATLLCCAHVDRSEELHDESKL